MSETHDSADALRYAFEAWQSNNALHRVAADAVRRWNTRRDHKRRADIDMVETSPGVWAITRSNSIG